MTDQAIKIGDTCRMNVSQHLPAWRELLVRIGLLRRPPPEWREFWVTAVKTETIAVYSDEPTKPGKTRSSTVVRSQRL